MVVLLSFYGLAKTTFIPPILDRLDPIVLLNETGTENGFLVISTVLFHAGGVLENKPSFLFSVLVFRSIVSSSFYSDSLENDPELEETLTPNMFLVILSDL